MSLKDRVSVFRVEDEAGREQALAVMRAIYRDEKNWVHADEKLVAETDITSADVSWFVVRVDSLPVAVLRVLYDLPIDLYRAYGFKMTRADFDLEAFLRDNRIAEIGRFAVLPEYRRYIIVVGAIMRAAVKETVERDFTHYITDVFEGEANSPYDFHRRVMGFQTVATHDTGELNCPCRRITMLLDIREAYQRMRKEAGWIFRFLTEDWTDHHHRCARGESHGELTKAGS
ncbi:MAG: GNAT family N-acetyltransferase [Verrucomicrobia bacterium]|nr:GNAT family N-acetyltransferase [Verrucomicrobiota bacterium]MBI3869043.1 GNAT family N-acetyltransferase [Verrucomicrobiota bacterium]